MKNKISKIIMEISISFFIMTFAIGFTILFRPFYYANIKILNLEQKSGYEYKVIKEAYDDVMDFLVFDEEFKTGELAYSTEGKAHFEDCKVLFDLNFYVLLISSGLIFIILALKKNKVIELKYEKLKIGVYATIFLVIIFGILGIWGILDFDGLFTVFHTVCFPGKTNWVFDSYNDQIINILPTSVWMAFAELIAFIILVFVFFIILNQIKQFKHRDNKNI